MEKLNQSNDWAATEVARLQKMASKRGTMAGKQLDDLQVGSICMQVMLHCVDRFEIACL